ncbi:MAG: M67 family metallopeptidase [Microscillaceae bacterium]|nr:M67 family metallopeptidase [Microscillaceae bacterium]
MKLNLSIDPDVIIAMQKHAEEAYPNECCGFFYGKDGEIRQILLSSPVDNSKEGDQRRRFEIHPKDYMRAEQFALLHDTTLLGVYHSHPEHPAIPSEHDLKQALPYFSYIIISVKSRLAEDMRSWRLNEEKQFIEELINE